MIVQEKRRTSAESRKHMQLIESQLQSHAQNNAMVIHGGDCDMFTCTGCGTREPDKIVSAPYEVESNVTHLCRVRDCKKYCSQWSENFCDFHMDVRCTAPYCCEEMEDVNEEFCLYHAREKQVMFWGK